MIVLIVRFILSGRWLLERFRMTSDHVIKRLQLDQKADQVQQASAKARVELLLEAMNFGEVGWPLLLTQIGEEQRNVTIKLCRTWRAGATGQINMR